MGLGQSTLVGNQLAENSPSREQRRTTAFRRSTIGSLTGDRDPAGPTWNRVGQRPATRSGWISWELGLATDRSTRRTGLEARCSARSSSTVRPRCGSSVALHVRDVQPELGAEHDAVFPGREPIGGERKRLGPVHAGDGGTLFGNYLGSMNQAQNPSQNETELHK